MPPRVVTADIESLLGVSVFASIAVPYRAGLALPGNMQGGRFVDILLYLPPGIESASELNTHVFESLNDTPARLKRLDDGPLHEIWGWQKRSAPLDPNNEDDAAIIAAGRWQCVTYDIGALLGWRVDDARFVADERGHAVTELLVNSPGNSANRPQDHVYDTLDAHPPGLRAALERSPWARRATEADDPPGWTQRKPGVP